MFSGIIETLGLIHEISAYGSGLRLLVESSITPELHVDQSVAHNGVCLTVEGIEGQAYLLTAVEETLRKTTLGEWRTGQYVNIERSLRLGDRLDGHIVQGHVDAVAECMGREDREGSWLFSFRYPEAQRHLIVEKGSICINGVSLTAFECTGHQFSVAIIPYTYQHTTFQYLQPGDKVNLEFDILGKYFLRWAESYRTLLPE